MAALPLCASPPAAVAAASLISRPFHGAMNVRPLGRAPAPVKLQARARDSFRSHCEKRADGLHEPDPEPENHDPDKAATPQNVPLVEKLLNYRRALFAAMGLREPPDMFLKEKEQISDYMMKLSCSADSRNLNESVVARMVCSEARQALNLASKVMDIAHDDPGTVEFSQHTIDQMVRTYATILYNVADHAYHEKIGIETTLSFLGALRGLGAICHILVQDIVAKLKDGHLKNKFIHHMDTLSQKFYTEVNNLEDKVARMKEQKELQFTDGNVLEHNILQFCGRDLAFTTWLCRRIKNQIDSKVKLNEGE
ncbi:hypothetical protein C2845_PM15G19910 [Panicum miliaceum]|uniref:Uncharacterized protein n=1 Tax=Panicum miliaceum TaxID=4540 RepID=A0A3L6Q9Q6_PANMI|nr:hypothetical protein C2845_PM15G19910 [Panicum miliaceum]